MKETLFLFTFLYSLVSFSQETFFSPGYYIDQSNTKKEGFIEDTNPYNNPEQINFKATLEDKSTVISIENIKEFKVNTNNKYVRSTVDYDFDQVINNTELTTFGKQPTLKQKTLLLKTLVEGSVSLYRAVIHDAVFFYIKNKNDDSPRLLVHRKYNVANTFEENNDFRRQLYDELKSETILLNDFLKIKYDENELMNIFKEANKENNSLVDQTIVNEKYKNKLYYKVFGGISSFTFPLKYREEFNLDPTNVTYTNPIFGVEFSTILGTNSKKSEFFLRLFYQQAKTQSYYYKSVFSSATNGGRDTSYTFSSDFSSISFLTGYRNALIKKANYKVSVDGSFGLSNVINGDFKVDYLIQYTGTNQQPPTQLQFDYSKFSSAFFFNFGIGYVYQNKYAINLEYSTPKSYLSRNAEIDGEFSNFNLIFTYTIN